ncbi:hypothetical protein IB276_10955 [Ensifer sp. ENS04]|uniref:hypothetical protein n=1 Tax=Ensifer sp. ENS04 TaxID=2769281 RepID=UPI00177D31DC|nr:hypothetical protein [Ensifer sp. ENS04]MBD9539970.1 hypothetical protein [Ensifer sp. ENS04]
MNEWPKQMMEAVISCPHSINRDEVILRFDPKAEGHNALNQLSRRLCAALASRPIEAEAVVWRSIETAPKTGEEFIARTGPEWSAFSCFWDGDAFVHYDKDDGFIRYEATQWMPMPEAGAANVTAPQPVAWLSEKRDGSKAARSILQQIEFLAREARPAQFHDVLNRIEQMASSAVSSEPASVERDYPAEFEAWWETYRHRNRDPADYNTKKQIAFDAFYFAALAAATPAPTDVVAIREAAQDLLNAQKVGQQHVGYRLDLWRTLEAVLSSPEGSGDDLTNRQKEMVLLRVIADMGGEVESSDSPHSWLNWFCSDEVHGKHSDTFNRCIENGWLASSHNSDFDSSTTWLTPAGRAAVVNDLNDLHSRHAPIGEGAGR